MKKDFWNITKFTSKLLGRLPSPKKILSMGMATSMLIGCTSMPSLPSLSNANKREKSYPSLRAMGLQPILLRFQANIGNERFSCRKSFANVGQSTDFIRFTDLRLYISEVMMVRKDGTTIPVALIQDSWQSGNVALLDFEDKTGACVEDGDPTRRTYIIGAAPFGEYEGVKFRIGVPQYYRLPGMPFIPRTGKKEISEMDVTGSRVSKITAVSRTDDGAEPYIQQSSPDRIRGGEVKDRIREESAESALQKILDKGQLSDKPMDESMKDKMEESMKDKMDKSTKDKMDESTKDKMDKSTKDKMDESTKDKMDDSMQDNMEDKTTDEEKGAEVPLSKQDQADMDRAEKDPDFGSPILDESTEQDIKKMTEVMPTKKDYPTYPSKNTSPMNIAVLPMGADEQQADSPRINADKLNDDGVYYPPQPESYKVGKVIATLPELDEKYDPKNAREEAMIRAGLGADMFRLMGSDGKALAYTDSNMPYVLRANNHMRENVQSGTVSGGALSIVTGHGIAGAALGALYGVANSRFRWYPVSREEISGLSPQDGTYPPSPMNIPRLYTKTGPGYAHMRIGMRSTNMSQRKLSSELSFRIGQGVCDYKKDSSLMCERDNRPLVELDNFNYRRNIIQMDILSLMYNAVIPAQNKPLEQDCTAEKDDYNCNTIFLNLGLNIETGEPLQSFRQDVFSFR